MREPTHFYLDESMLAQRVREAIEQAGHIVHACGEEIPRGVPDTEWMKALANRDWIVLMRDQRIRYNQLELESLAQSKIGAFVFTGGQVTGEETARIIGTCLNSIIRLNKSTPRPYIFRITQTGNITRAR